MDYYRILGLRQNASGVEIRNAYKKKAMKYHPDKNMSCCEDAALRFKSVQEAFEILSDAEQRKKYDANYFHDRLYATREYDYDVETDEMGLDVHDMSIHKLCDLKDAFDDDISWSILQSSCEKTDFYSTK